MPGGASVDEIGHLRELLDERTAAIRAEYVALKTLLDERYATQTKALDAAFVAAEKAVTTALESADRAVAKAELAADKRFESVNEFRAQLADQAGQFVTKVEFDALKERFTDMSGQHAGAKTTRASLITGAGLLVAIIVAVVTILALNG